MANTFAAKLSVAFVAIAMALSMVAPAQAQTAEELQAQIDTLMATIASLQGQLGVSTPVATGNAYVFTRDLTIGSTGADVTALQNYLIGAGFSIPAGATGYFGSQTQAAVAAWQTANGVMPAAGYFGPVSQAKYTALVAVSTPTTPDEDEDEDESEDEDSSELSGEASLDTVEVEDGDDTEIEEGQEAAPVADINVEFTDGDAQITRIDVALVATDDGNDEVDPWDVFEEVSLWVDGDEVASMAADDEDEYLDEDDGSLRFTGLDIVAMEDEEVTITVAVTVQGSVDGTNDGSTWDLYAQSIRYVDADDVTTTDDETDDLESDNTGDSAEFEIDEEGGEDEITVGSSTEDPEATTLILEDDSKSDYMTFFAFDLDTDDSTNDIEINEIPVTIITDTDSFNDTVSDLQLVIDGEEFDDWDFSAGNTGATTTTVVIFNIDGDLTIDAGEEVTVEVQAEFKALAIEGTTIQGQVTSANADAIDAEGATDLDATQLSGSATGDEHTLRTSGLIVDLSSIESETSTQGDNDTTGIFEISFDVTATEGDFYVTDFAGTAADTTTGGVEFSVEGPGAASSSNGVLASTADEDTPGVFTVREGQTETFTLTVTVDAGTSGQHRVVLEELIYSEDTDGVTGSEVQALEPVADYRTDYENINAN